MSFGPLLRRFCWLDGLGRFAEKLVIQPALCLTT
jgi:hypothetical protein